VTADDVRTSNPLERALLASTVHAVKAGEDLILLDLETDDYLLIAECPTARVDGEVLHGSMDLLLDLAANELLQSGDSASSRPRPPSLPTCGLPEVGTRRPSLQDIATFGLIWADAVRRKPTLKALSMAVSHRQRRHSDLVAVSARVEVFRQLLPLAPSVGACLFPSELLLRFLNAAGLDADWVFGVRTWPFLAHCWLQIDDYCVSQNPETLTIYRPIMVL